MKRFLWIIVVLILMGGHVVSQQPLQTCSNPNGNVDNQNCDFISGWAWCPASPNDAVIVELYEGSYKIGEIIADKLRGDLSTYGNGRHAFDFPVSGLLRDGLVHQLSLKVKGSTYTLNNGNRTFQCGSYCSNAVAQPMISASAKTILPGQSVTLTAGGCDGTVNWSTRQTGTSITVTPGVSTTYYAACEVNGCNSNAKTIDVLVGVNSCTSPGGYVDGHDCEGINGWIWCSSSPNSPIVLEVFEGGTKWGEVYADRFRQDLKDAGRGNGYHGFYFPVPQQYQDGRNHAITVKAKNSSYILQNGSRNYNCGVAAFGSCGYAMERPILTASVRTFTKDENLVATVNSGQSVTLSAGNCNGTLLWSTGQTGNSITVSPTTNTTYTVMCQSGTCTSGTRVIDLLISAPNCSTGSGFVDNRNCDWIWGWAWCSSSPNSPTIVELYDGSTKVTEFVADGFRQDLQNGGYGNGYHAFSFWIPSGLKNGQNHNLSLRVKGSSNVLSNGSFSYNCGSTGACPTIDRPVVVSTNKTISGGQSVQLTAGGCAGSIIWSNGQTTNTITVSPTISTVYTASCRVNNCTGDATEITVLVGNTSCSSPQGNVDASSCEGLWGWAWCPSTPNAPAIVEIWEGNTKWGEVYANNFRQDLKDAGQGNGFHAFYFAIPPQFKDGRGHNILVKVKGSSSYILNNGSRFYACSNPCSGWVEKPALGTSTRAFLRDETIVTSITSGQNVTITAGNCAGTVLWSNGLTGNSINVSPTSNTTYSASCQVNNCFSGPRFVEVLVTQNTCTGSSSGYVDWNDCNGISGWAWCSSTPNNPIIVEFFEGSTKVGEVTADGYRQDLRDGGKGNGFHSYYFPIPQSLRNGQNRVVTAKIKGTGTALINGTRTINCPNPCSNIFGTFIVTSTSPSICSGQSTTLTAVGCPGNVTWSNGQSGLSIVVTPPTNTTYNAICNLNGCTSPTASATVVVYTAAPPAISASPNPLCQGQSSTLTAANCAGTVIWSNGMSGNSISVTPSATASYNATCTVNGCVSGASNTITVTVNPIPSPPAIQPVGPSTICNGTTVQLQASNCSGTVIWSNGMSGNPITVTPTNTTTYTAGCRVNNCTSGLSNGVTITVNPIPTAPVVSTTKSTVCVGEMTTLNAANCGGTVTWSNGVSGASINVSPTSTTAYTATCTVNNCTGPAGNSLTIVVNPLPAPPSISSNKYVMCNGETATLSAANCSGTVVWSNGATGSSISVSPTGNTVYTARCMVNGCQSGLSNIVNITVNPIPGPPTISASSNPICVGQSSTLTATNCSGTVTWSTGVSSNSISVVPTVTTHYTATCTVNGCTSSSSSVVIVTVKPKPSPPAVSPVVRCGSGSVMLNALGCSGTVRWYNMASGGSLLFMGNPYTVNINSTTTYYADCLSPDNCVSDSRTAVTATINTIPSPPTVPSVARCGSGSVTLNASGCTGTVRWFDASTGGNLLFSGNPFTTPNLSSTTTYYADCLSPANCVSASRTAATAFINPIPAPTLSGGTICNTQSFTLNAGNCTGTISWSDGTYPNPRSVSPTTTTTYTATCSVSANGLTCSGSVSTTVTVNPLPSPPTVPSAARCGAGSVTLNASGCSGSVRWYSAASGGSALFTGNAYVTPGLNLTTTYYADCLSPANCVSASRTAATAFINPIPAPTLSGGTICNTQSFTLNAGNCTGTISWSDGTYPNPRSVSPTTTTTYTATCSVSANGLTCSGSVSATVTVNPLPSPPTVPSAARCGAGSVTLNASGCSGSVRWYSAASGGLALFTGNAYVTPGLNSTTTYYADCLSPANCVSASRTAATAFINPIPAPTLSGGTICNTQSFTLNAGNCTGTVKWSDGTFPNPRSVSPTATTTYTATCSVSANGITCSGSISATVTVNPLPSPPTASSVTICGKGPLTLSAVGCSGGTIKWFSAASGGTQLATGVSYSPSNTNSDTTVIAAKTYYLECISSAGCVSSTRNSVVATWKPIPAAPVITANKSTICAGDSITLTAGNCTGTVTWSNLKSGTSIVVRDTVSYFARCTVNGCISLKSNIIKPIVNAIPPDPVINLSKSRVCVGTPITLTVNNCNGTVLWTGSTNGSGRSITVSPTLISRTYSAVCRSSQTCDSRNFTTVTVPVDSVPKAPVISALKLSICQGDSTLLSATGCPTGIIRWSNNKTGRQIWIGSSIVGNMVLTAACRLDSCISTVSNSLTIKVNTKPSTPTITAGADIVCAGSPVTLTASGCVGVISWVGLNKTGNSAIVKPLQTTAYQAVCISLDNCSSTAASKTIQVKPRPSTVSLIVNKVSPCAGDSVSVSAQGCANGTVVWLDGTVARQIRRVVLTNTAFGAVCVINGCRSDTTYTSVQVIQLSPPQLTASRQELNNPGPGPQGDSSVVVATGCSGAGYSVRWSTGQTANSIVVRPLASTDYLAYCRFNGCESKPAKLRIKVNGTYPPVIDVLARMQPYTGNPPKRTVRIRWVPNTPQSWRYGNQYGYRLVRRNLATNDSTVLNLSPLKPNSTFFAPYLNNVSTDPSVKYKGMIGNSIFGQFARDTTDGVHIALDSLGSADPYYAIALMSADLDFDAAVKAGLGFVDTTANANQRYVYRVYSEVPVNILTIDSESDTVNTGPYVSLPRPVLTPKWGNRKVEVAWNANTPNHYNAFHVERSENGSNYIRRTEEPLSAIFKDSLTAARGVIVFMDSLPQNNKTYYYRIIGYTPLGEQVISVPVQGQGKNTPTFAVRMTKSAMLDFSRASIGWGYVPAFSDSAYKPTGVKPFGLSKTQVLKAAQERGPYSIVATLTDTTVTQYTLTNLSSSTYIVVRAITKTSDTLVSVPELVQPNDTIPPAAPTGLTYTVLRGNSPSDSLTVFRISWAANPAADRVASYRLYRAYRAGEEPLLTMDDSLVTSYTDTVNSKMLNRYVFYQVKAKDNRGNQSDPSATLRAKKPDVIPPSSPVFLAYSTENGSVNLRWANSSDNDVMKHLLVRRQLRIADTSWVNLGEFYDAADTTFSDFDIEPEAVYVYSLMAQDSSQLLSPPAQPLVVQIPVTMITRPALSNFTATPEYTFNRIRLTWSYTPPSGLQVTEYQIYKKTGTEPSAQWRTIDAGDTQTFDYETVNDTLYEYSIRAVLSDGTGTNARTISVNFKK